MATSSLYGDRAALYDRIYHWKDYGAEARRLTALLDEAGVPRGGRLVEAACGTGSHLKELTGTFTVSGFDLSEAMLTVARAKLPEVPLFCADMCSFELETPCHALICLFSSIGYVHPEQRLHAATAAFARAVRPGGVVVVEPWLTPESYVLPHASIHTYDGSDLKLCRACVAERHGRLSRFDFHWLVADPTTGVEHFTERHELWLYTREEMLAAFDRAGFETRYEDDGLMPGRGLYVGRRR